VATWFLGPIGSILSLCSMVGVCERGDKGKISAGDMMRYVDPLSQVFTIN